MKKEDLVYLLIGSFLALLVFSGGYWLGMRGAAEKLMAFEGEVKRLQSEVTEMSSTEYRAAAGVPYYNMGYEMAKKEADGAYERGWNACYAKVRKDLDDPKSELHKGMMNWYRQKVAADMALEAGLIRTKNR